MPRRPKREIELSPELADHLLTLHPNDAVTHLMANEGLTEAEAKDVVMQLMQEASVTAELAQTLLRMPPQEAVRMLLENPAFGGSMTPEMAIEMVQGLRAGFQEQYLTEVARRVEEARIWPQLTSA